MVGSSSMICNLVFHIITSAQHSLRTCTDMNCERDFVFSSRTSVDSPSLAQYHRRPSSFSPLPIVSRLFMYSLSGAAPLMLDGITSFSSGDITHIVMMVTTCVTLSLR